jgi:hypothetical protein
MIALVPMEVLPTSTTLLPFFSLEGSVLADPRFSSSRYVRGAMLHNDSYRERLPTRRSRQSLEIVAY